MKKFVFVTLVVTFAAACSSGAGPHTVSVPTSSAASSSASGRVPATCAAELPSSVGNPGVPGIARTMVPITATAARVCKYAPLDAKVPNALQHFGLTSSPGAVQHLEAVTNALDHISNAERIPCPLVPNTPGWTVAFVSGAVRVTLVVSASDCGFVTNGTISAGPTASWLDLLGRIAAAG